MIRFGLVVVLLGIAACGSKDVAADGSGSDTDGGDTGEPDGQCEVEIQRTYLDGFVSMWGDGQTVWATGYGIAVAGTAEAIAVVSPQEFAYGDRVTGVEGRVFTAGWGELMEFADGEWIRHEGPQIQVFGLWAAAADEVWLVSENQEECEGCTDPPPTLPYASRWDGTTWIEDSPPASAGLRDVWGVGADDLHVVGGEGVAFRRLDGEWIELATGTASELVRVRGNRADNVWALGSDGTVLHFDGAGWSAAASVTNVWAKSLWVGDDDTVYVLGEPTIEGEDPGDGPTVVMRLEADVWTPLGAPLEGQGLDLWGDDAALWVAGKTNGPVLHRIALEDPAEVTEQFHAQNLEGLESLQAIDAEHAVAVSGSASFDEYRDGQWSGSTLGDDVHVKAVWATEAEVFVSAYHGDVTSPMGTTFRVQGDEITELTVPDPQALSLRAIWGRSATDVWTGGDDEPFCDPMCPPSGGPRLLHFDGEVWTDAAPPPSVVARLHGDAQRLVAATWNGLFVQENGAWTQIPTPQDANIGDTVVTEDGTIWAVVDSALYRVQDGAAVLEPNTPTGSVFAIAVSPGGLVLSGDATPDAVTTGFAARLEGSTWTLLLTTPSELLHAAAWADDTLFLASPNIALRLGCPSGP
jgi:hypothetical protein